MTPKQLTYFVRIAEFGSFSAAAKSISIAQPALSFQIAKLEQDLGSDLFYRNPRGVELTECGARLLPQAYAILRQIEATKLDVQSADIEPVGAVRVGMVPAINNALASQLSKVMEDRYPQIELEIIGGASHYLNQQLNNRVLDIGLVHPDSAGFGDLISSPLLRETLFFVGSAANKFQHISLRNGEKCIRFRDIAHYSVLSTEVHDGLGYRIRQYEEEMNVVLNKRRSYGQLLTDLNVIMAGEANMILPWSAIYHLQGEKGLETAMIIEPDMYRDIFLLTSPRQPLTNVLVKTQSVIQSLIDPMFHDRRSIGTPLIG